MNVFSASVFSYLMLVLSIYAPIPSHTSPTVTSTNPVVVIAPAAWHSPSHYQYLAAQFGLVGINVVMRQLPSCGCSNPRAQSVTNDAAFITRSMLEPLIDAGERVVLIMHSYSGGPGAMAAKGLSINERRAAGQTGGIIGLVFISAFLAQPGQTLISGSGGQYAPWVIQYDDGQLGVRDAKEWLFNGVPDRVSILVAAQLKNESRYAAETPCGSQAWADPAYDNRRSYARCALDKAIAPAAQDFMLQQSGVRWNVKDFQTGHAPFLSKPKELADWVVAEISRWDTGNAKSVVTPSGADSVDVA